MINVLDHFGIVYKLAQKFHSPYIEHADLIQEGKKALVEAVNHFDEEMGFEFSTFAYPYVRGHLIRYVRANLTIAHLPAYKKKDFADDLALDEEWDDGKRKWDVRDSQDFFKEFNDAFYWVAINNMIRKAIYAVGSLTLKEVILIIMRYGILDGKLKSFRALSPQFGATYQRLQQIEASAIKKLRASERLRTIYEDVLKHGEA